MRYEAVVASADATAIETAEIELAIAQSDLEAASKAHNVTLTNVQTASIAEETAAKEAQIAATAAATATTEADTAAKELNTLALNQDAAATGMLTAMTNALKSAVTKCYAAMTAHPYAILLAAVTALGYAIYKVATYESEQEKAAKAAASASSQSVAQYQKERAELDKLADKLATTKKDTNEWQVAKDEVVAKYGKYFSGLDNEITKVGNLSTAYKQLQLNVRKAAAARAMEDYGKGFEPDYNKYLTTIQGKLSGMSDDAQAKIMEMAYNYITGASNDFSNAMWSTLKQLGVTSILQRGAQNTENYQKNISTIGRRFGFNQEQSQAISSGDDSAFAETEKEVKNLAEEYKKAEKAWNGAKTELAKINANRAKYTTEEYNAAVSNEKSAKDAFEKLGGDVKETDEKRSKRLQKEQTEEEKRVERRKELELELIELQRSNIADEISLMKDGTKKKIREIENEYQARREAIAKEAEKLAKANKEAGIKGAATLTIGATSVSGLTTEQLTSLQQSASLAQFAMQKQTSTLYKEEADALKKRLSDGLSEINDYEKRKTEIIDRETKRRAEIAKATKLKPEEKAKLTARSYYTQSEELTEISTQQFTASDDYAKVFSNLDRLSVKTLASIKARLQEVISTATNLEPDKMKALVEAMDKITMEQESRNPIASAVDSVREYMQAQSELSKAEAELAQAQSEWEQNRVTLEANVTAAKEAQAAAQERVDKLEKEGNTESEEMMDAEVALAWAKKNTKKAEEEKAAATKKVETANKNVAKESDKAQKASSKWQTSVKQIATTCDEVATAIQDVVNLLSIAEDSTIGQLIQGAVSGLQTMSTIMTTILAISIAINASMGWAAAIGAAVGIFASLGSIFQGNKVKKANEEIEKQQDLIDDYAHTLERLQKAADDLFGAQWLNNFTSQEQVLQAQMRAYEKQLQAERSKGKDADEDKIDEYEDKIQELADELADLNGQVAEKMLGSSLSSLSSQFASAALEARKTWSNLTSAMKDEWQDAIEQMAVNSVLGQAMERALQPVYDMIDNMTTTDFYDSDFWSKLASQAAYSSQQAAYGAQTMLNFLEDAGITLSDTSSELTGYSREIATASEESITGLTVATNTQNVYLSHVPNIADNVATIAALLQGGSVTNTTTNVGAQDLLAMQNQYLATLPSINANTTELANKCTTLAAECRTIRQQLDKVIKASPSGYKVQTAL
jgi:hypothetical protein